MQQKQKHLMEQKVYYIANLCHVSLSHLLQQFYGTNVIHDKFLWWCHLKIMSLYLRFRYKAYRINAKISHMVSQTFLSTCYNVAFHVYEIDLVFLSLIFKKGIFYNLSTDLLSLYVF